MKSLLVIFFVSICAYSQVRYSPQDLGLSLKYGNIDRGKLDSKATIAADFSNDKLEDVILYDKSVQTLNYYQNEGNGYMILLKIINTGPAESISLMESGKENSIAVIYAGGRIRVISSKELNSAPNQEETNNPPFVSSKTEFNFNEVWVSPNGLRASYNCIAADIDNDSKNEVIFTGRPDTLGDCDYTYIYVYESTGDNTYTLDWDTLYTVTGTGACIGRIDTMDINNDGKKEIAFQDGDVTSGESYLKFLECSGPGQYKVYTSNIALFLQYGYYSVYKIIECDVNHNGIKEVVTLCSKLNVPSDYTVIQVSTFSQKTATHYLFNTKLVKYQSPCGDMDVGDINGDGKDELILGGSSWYNDELYYFDSTGSNIIIGGNGGAGYEFKVIYTGRTMGAVGVLARDINSDNKKEWLLSAIGDGYGGFAVVRHISGNIFNVEMYDTSLYNALGASIAFTTLNNSDYVFYPRTRWFVPNNIYHGYLHVYKKTGNFIFEQVYYNDFYPTVGIFEGLNILDMDFDRKISIVSVKFIQQVQFNSYYISDLENEFPIGIINNQVPVKFGLYQNYPNPFNPVTNIKYQITNNGYVSIKLYDILGKEITSLVNRIQHPGLYEVEFNGSGYASGIYFYSLEIDGIVFGTKKMLMVK